MSLCLEFPILAYQENFYLSRKNFTKRLTMETLNSDEYFRLKNIFDDTGSDDEFLGFSDDESCPGEEEKDPISESVDIDSINEASNSKTSGYGSESNDDLSSDSDDLSDSDDEETSRKKRDQAMKNRQELLKNIMSDLRNEPVFKQMISLTPKEMMRQNQTPRQRTVRRYYTHRSLPPVTRRRSKLGEDPDFTPEKDVNNKPRLLVRFGPKRRLSVGDEDDDESPSPKRRSYTRRSYNTQEHVMIPVEDITEEMLDNIAQYSVGKEYNAVSGTSCHQCRQKTMDTKSCCRSKECVGVRGQFCGPCLQNRYGESVRDALLNPDWSCPVCRGFCNCSICRNRNGKCATGILIGLAKHHGFTNVKDYLASLKSENKFIVED